MSFHFGANDPLQDKGIDCGTCRGFDAFGLYCACTHGDDCKDALKAASASLGMNGRTNSGKRRKTYNTTDLGNAEFFADEYGDDLRYVSEWKSWIIWDGRRWQTDGRGRVNRLAYKLVKSRMADHAKEIDDGRKRSDYYKHIASSQSRSRIENMIALAAPMLCVAAADLDSNPWLFNCANGTIDLETGTVHSHDRDDLLTKLSPVEFDADAECPLWDKFLRRIFSDRRTEQPRLDLIAFIQRSAGYSLTGSVSSHGLWILHGAGANGKTTLMNAMQHVMGDYAIAAQQSLLMADSRFKSKSGDEADLLGVRLAVCSETDEGQRFAESKIKRITGGSKIRDRRLYENSFEFEPTHKIWLDCNHKPKIKGTDYAIKRRIMFVPFEVTIREAERDEQLGEKLKAEASGILNWMLAGLREWQDGGLRPPPVVLQAVDEYMIENDLVGQFLAEKTTACSNARLSVDGLYREYKSWCDDNGMDHAMTKIAFGKTMTDRGNDKKKSGSWYWIDLELVSEGGDGGDSAEDENDPAYAELFKSN